MKEANIEINGENVRVDLRTFMDMRAADPTLARKPTCPECGHRVHPFNQAGAKGFRTVNLEVTRRDFANRRSEPGFHHMDHSAGKDCSLSFANDPRYKGIREGNEFRIEERERNILALAKPGVREAIEQVQNYFMRKLLDKPDVSSELRKKLDKIQNRLLNMVGLHKNLWILGFMPPMLLEPQTRLLRNHRVARVEYINRGQQHVPYVGDDGQNRVMLLPAKLVPSYSRRGGKPPNPMRIYKGGPEITYEISRAAAAKIVLDARATAQQVAAKLIASKQKVATETTMEKLKHDVQPELPLFLPQYPKSKGPGH